VLIVASAQGGGVEVSEGYCGRRPFLQSQRAGLVDVRNCTLFYRPPAVGGCLELWTLQVGVAQSQLQLGRALKASALKLLEGISLDSQEWSVLFEQFHLNANLTFAGGSPLYAPLLMAIWCWGFPSPARGPGGGGGSGVQ